MVAEKAWFIAKNKNQNPPPGPQIKQSSLTNETEFFVKNLIFAFAPSNGNNIIVLQKQLCLVRCLSDRCLKKFFYFSWKSLLVDGIDFFSMQHNQSAHSSLPGLRIHQDISGILLSFVNKMMLPVELEAQETHSKSSLNYSLKTFGPQEGIMLVFKIVCVRTCV